jgi:hypothetical protein
MRPGRSPDRPVLTGARRAVTADPHANCDRSTTPPTLNIADFSCFLQKFATDCP